MSLELVEQNLELVGFLLTLVLVVYELDQGYDLFELILTSRYLVVLIIGLFIRVIRALE